MKNPLDLNRKEFAGDPFGYSASSYLAWTILQNQAGYPIDISQSATSEDLKNPILWMSHAHALSTAAQIVLITEPKFHEMPFGIKNICDRQYCSVGLMLVGYSLEISLKSMIIIMLGIDGYKEIERKTQHHRLEELSEFIPFLSEKDKSILRCLTCFVYWAGRYPDPGRPRLQEMDELFNLAEKYQITAGDVFDVSIRVMRHVNKIIDDKKQ